MSLAVSRVLNGVTGLAVNDGVAVITIDSPPVNALSAPVREGLFAGVKQALDDPAAEAIVLICAGKTFIVGADIKELGKAKAPPTVWQIQALIEGAAKPVIAAIHGTALGGGLELALCAHFRVALRSARLGLPEVQLGLLPGAGGTQRLPRLVGLAPALEMMTSGRHVTADEARRIGLVDAIIDADLPAGAKSFARSAARLRLPLVSLRASRGKLGCADSAALFTDFRTRHPDRFHGYKAPEAIVRCIEAAVSLPWEDAIAVERRLFQQLLSTQEAAAQRYSFLAERKLRRPPTAIIASLGEVLLVPDEPKSPAGIGSPPPWRVRWDKADRDAQFTFAKTGEALPDAELCAILERLCDDRIGVTVTSATPGEDAWRCHALRLRRHRRADGRVLIEIVAPAGTSPLAFSALSRLATRTGALAVCVTADAFASDSLCRSMMMAMAKLEATGIAPERLSTTLASFGLIEPGTVSPLAAGLPARAETTEPPLIDQLVCMIVNDSLALIERGALARACEVDMLAQAAAGWPIYRGGPLCYGDWIGPPRLIALIEALHAQGVPIDSAGLLLKAAADKTRLVDIGD